MYRAKQMGCNNYQFYTPEMNAQASLRLTLENSLRGALEREEFVLFYQPQVDLKTGRIVGAEALLRWRRPDAGLVPPAEFIHVLEESGLIVPVGDWVLRTACAQGKAWENADLPPLRVAVNLSPRQFSQQNLAGRLARILDETGLDPGWLELELTESLLMQDIDVSSAMLDELRMLMGLKLCIDDFGTGYSSLSYLKRFPLDTLKIDARLSGTSPPTPTTRPSSAPSSASRTTCASRWSPRGLRGRSNWTTCANMAATRYRTTISASRYPPKSSPNC